MLIQFLLYIDQTEKFLNDIIIIDNLKEII